MRLLKLLLFLAPWGVAGAEPGRPPSAFVSYYELGTGLLEAAHGELKGLLKIARREAGVGGEQ